jgi:hypothetical protein
LKKFASFHFAASFALDEAILSDRCTVVVGGIPAHVTKNTPIRATINIELSAGSLFTILIAHHINNECCEAKAIATFEKTLGLRRCS